MANLDHIRELKNGAHSWNLWRKSIPNFRPDLSGADLAGMDLEDANLTSADLQAANLSKANLQGAILRSANLQDADLRGAFMSDINLMDARLASQDLRKAKLHGAFLYRTRLEGADLSEAFLGGSILIEAVLVDANLSMARLNQVNLTGAQLKGANLTGASCDRTVFANVDLSQAIGLETIEHKGPSSVGVDTLIRSSGNVSPVFLRGTGVPDEMVTFSDSLSSGRSFYSAFISYSTEDEDFARKLYADLQDSGVRCWYAPEDLRIGALYIDDIAESIGRHDKLLLVLSHHSISSNWVEQEVNTARVTEEATGRTVLFPIRLDGSIMDITIGWPAYVKNSRQIGDFRNWKEHDKYQVALERLIRDLKK